MNWKGERKQKCKRGFTTKREAQEWERMFQLQNLSDLDMSFEAFTELYINDVKNRLKENTWLTKEHIIRTKLLPYFGKLKISEISTKEIITWQNEMLAYRDDKKKPYSQAYLKTLHNQLSAIFNHAVRYYELRSNPAAKVGNMGSEEHKEMLFWTREEYKKFASEMMDKPVSFYGELVFDVNTTYFHNHGGYEFAKQFYTDAYKAAIKIVGGEQYILSAVMHADERNRAMSDALRQDVYHYHLHVVYLPVVEKQLLWSKRCKDESLRGTVKELIQQVSMSKKWDSKPALDEHGKPLLNANGKTVLRKSYSVLQDDFFAAMRKAGYDDVERGERGSSEEHLTVTQFKVQQEQARLESIEDTIDRRKQTLEKYNEKIREQKGAAASFHEIDSIGKKTISGNISMTPQDAQFLKELAKEGVASRGLIGDLKNKVETLKRDVSVWKRKYEKLQEQTKDFMAALKRAPRKVKEFIQFMLHTEPEKPEQSGNRDMPRRKKRDMEL